MPLPIVGRTTGEKNQQEGLHNPISQLDLVDLCRALHSTEETTCFFKYTAEKGVSHEMGNERKRPLEVQWAKCFQFHHLMAWWGFQTENSCTWNRIRKLQRALCCCCCCLLAAWYHCACPSHPPASFRTSQFTKPFTNILSLTRSSQPPCKEGIWCFLQFFFLLYLLLPFTNKQNTGSSDKTSDLTSS